MSTLSASSEFPHMSEPVRIATSQQYALVRTRLRDWVRESAGRAELLTIGINDQGAPIEGVLFGEPTQSIALLVATHHGNEYGSTSVALAVGDSIAQAPLQGRSVLVVPVLNIGGFERRVRQETDRTGRSRDPNRDYPNPCKSEPNYYLSSTRALADLIDRMPITSVATLHTFHPAVVYPWGFTTRDRDTRYNDLYRQLASAAVRDSHYQTGNSAEVIYPANGTLEDYSFLRKGAWSLLFELGPSHWPSNNQLEIMNQVNVTGIRAFFESAPQTVAQHHAFEGTCDASLEGLDRHDE